MASQKTFTKKQINDQIESVLADNTSQAISAADVRSVVKDYMTESLSAPVLIYSGLWRQAVTNSGIGSSPDVPSSVEDYYYNPDFFQLQSDNGPISISNIYQADTASLPGVNGLVQLRSAVENGLEVTINVTNGLLAAMTIQQHGTGFTVGQTINLFNTNGTAFTALTLTYNGAARVTGENSTARFVLTTNSDNTYLDHGSANSILSATPQFVPGFINTGNNSSVYRFFSGINFTSTNTLRCHNAYLGGTTYRTSNSTHVQIYRIPGK